MCRAPAAELHAKKPQLDQAGIRLVAIVKEDISGEIAEFQKVAWPEADVFIDESMDLYRMAHDGGFKKTSAAGVCGFLCKLVCCQRRRAIKVKRSISSFGNNGKGEGFILGSTLVVDANGQVIYAHAEQAFDHHPDAQEIVDAALKASGSCNSAQKDEVK